MKRKAYGRDAGLSLRMLLTSVLLGLLYVFFALVLFYIFNAGLVLMLVIVIGMALFQYFTSDKLALRASGAKIVTPEEAPKLHEMIERLAAMADLQKPRVAIVDTPVPNAFATGRNQKHAVVAVTTRALGAARREGDRGRARPRAVAHREPRRARDDGRVVLRDARSVPDPNSASTAACSAAGAATATTTTAVPVWLIVTLVSVVTYFLSWILIRTISRYREYAADRGSALITGAPEYLMSALQKISSQMTLIPQQDLRQVEGMNAFFIIPANVKKATSELFMDHPPLEKRLAALEKIAREMGRPVA